MDLKILKSGDYSFHSAYGPVETFEVGLVLIDYDDGKATKLISDLWAEKIEILEKTKNIEETEKVKEIDSLEELGGLEGIIKSRKILFDLIEQFETLKEKKQSIQDWGVLNLGEKVSKKNSIEVMVEMMMDLIYDEKSEEEIKIGD